MVTITRSLARQLRATFRRTGAGRSGVRTWITFLAAVDGLRIRLKTQDVALEYFQAGEFQPDQLSIPFEFLADCEGRKDEPVTLQVQTNGRALVNWSDRGVPQMVQYDADPTAEEIAFPALPERLQTTEPEFWLALADAAQTCDRTRIRYALDCLHLRGASGQIATTNGRHILVQSGFIFPWPDDVLIPACGVLGCSELATEHGFTLGKTDDWVTLVAGPWSVFVKIEKNATFPKLDDLFRPGDQARSRLHLEPTDARFLTDALPRLPGGQDTNCPITLDLNGRVVIRAADEERTSLAELTLVNSSSSGDPIRINVNRNLLLRAAKLGFTQFWLFGPEAPVQCDDGRRKYLWAVLDAKSALAPGDNPVCITSPPIAGPPAATTAPAKPQTSIMPKSTNHKSKPPNNEESPPSATPAEGAKLESPIEQALALRCALRETLDQTNHLISALKRQNRQSKLVQTTLAALEELRSAG